MARIARIMTEDCPFHITHRGNHRQKIFFRDEHLREYLALLSNCAGKFGMSVWAYCLMPNHVHLIALGHKRDSIAKAVGNAHRIFSRRRNLEGDVTGHLWANRYFSTALDETHRWAAVRYVELNPVRGGLATRAADYPWSSARMQGSTVQGGLLDPARPFPGPIGDWTAWLDIGLGENEVQELRRNTATGKPTGSLSFAAELKSRVGRPVAGRKREPAPPCRSKLSPIS